MFQMTVEDVSVVLDNVTVSGTCINKKDFTSKLVDDKGTEYAAFLPFIKHVVPPGTDYITLEIKGGARKNINKGMVLRGISQ